MYPRDRIKRFRKNYLIRNQADKKNYPQILPQKKADTKKIKTKIKILNILKNFATSA